ncbi:hypothetical protein EVAR_46809_1 [Eumeta japonica]|uniref:Nose resistant to fluoxetine protein 6 n=1 Tax=Eumeta variegata TaxID=151549 RepID=A0A4C1XG23_EUMVA|nr:hypothetical protein EVAR_46809_1 [Eumeta japonica]
MLEMGAYKIERRRLCDSRPAYYLQRSTPVVPRPRFPAQKRNEWRQKIIENERPTWEERSYTTLTKTYPSARTSIVCDKSVQSSRPTKLCWGDVNPWSVWWSSERHNARGVDLCNFLNSEGLHILNEGNTPAFKKLSENDQVYFNHSRIHRAICLGPKSSCPINDDLVDSFEGCVDQRMSRDYGLIARLMKLYFCRRSGDKLEMDGVSKSFIAFLIVVVLLNAIGSAYDVFIKDSNGKGKQWLIAFSIPRNWEKLTSPSKVSDPRLQKLVYVHGFRIQPMQLMTIGIVANVAPHLGDGPYWYRNMVEDSKVYRDTWWHHALFINNFFEPKASSLLQTWYLAADFQQYIISCVIMLWIIKKGLDLEYVLSRLLVVSLLGVFSLVFILDFESDFKVIKPEHDSNKCPNDCVHVYSLKKWTQSGRRPRGVLRRSTYVSAVLNVRGDGIFVGATIICMGVWAMVSSVRPI